MVWGVPPGTFPYVGPDPVVVAARHEKRNREVTEGSFDIVKQGRFVVNNVAIENGKIQTLLQFFLIEPPDQISVGFLKVGLRLSIVPIGCHHKPQGEGYGGGSRCVER